MIRDPTKKANPWLLRDQVLLFELYPTQFASPCPPDIPLPQFPKVSPTPTRLPSRNKNVKNVVPPHRTLMGQPRTISTAPSRVLELPQTIADETEISPERALLNSAVMYTNERVTKGDVMALTHDDKRQHLIAVLHQRDGYDVDTMQRWSDERVANTVLAKYNNLPEDVMGMVRKPGPWQSAILAGQPTVTFHEQLSTVPTGNKLVGALTSFTPRPPPTRYQQATGYSTVSDASEKQQPTTLDMDVDDDDVMTGTSISYRKHQKILNTRTHRLTMIFQMKLRQQFDFLVSRMEEMVTNHQAEVNQLVEKIHTLQEACAQYSRQLDIAETELVEMKQHPKGGRVTPSTIGTPPFMQGAPPPSAAISPLPISIDDKPSSPPEEGKCEKSSSNMTNTNNNKTNGLATSSNSALLSTVVSNPKYIQTRVAASTNVMHGYKTVGSSSTITHQSPTQSKKAPLHKASNAKVATATEHNKATAAAGDVSPSGDPVICCVSALGSGPPPRHSQKSGGVPKHDNSNNMAVITGLEACTSASSILSVTTNKSGQSSGGSADPNTSEGRRSRTNSVRSRSSTSNIRSLTHSTKSMDGTVGDKNPQHTHHAPLAFLSTSHESGSVPHLGSEHPLPSGDVYTMEITAKLENIRKQSQAISVGFDKQLDTSRAALTELQTNLESWSAATTTGQHSHPLPITTTETSSNDPPITKHVVEAVKRELDAAKDEIAFLQAEQMKLDALIVDFGERLTTKKGKEAELMDQMEQMQDVHRQRTADYELVGMLRRLMENPEFVTVPQQVTATSGEDEAVVPAPLPVFQLPAMTSMTPQPSQPPQPTPSGKPPTVQETASANLQALAGALQELIQQQQQRKAKEGLSAAQQTLVGGKGATGAPPLSSSSLLNSTTSFHNMSTPVSEARDDLNSSINSTSRLRKNTLISFNVPRQNAQEVVDPENLREDSGGGGGYGETPISWYERRRRSSTTTAVSSTILRFPAFKNLADSAGIYVEGISASTTAPEVKELLVQHGAPLSVLGLISLPAVMPPTLICFKKLSALHQCIKGTNGTALPGGTLSCRLSEEDLVNLVGAGVCQLKLDGWPVTHHASMKAMFEAFGQVKDVEPMGANPPVFAINFTEAASAAKAVAALNASRIEKHILISISPQTLLEYAQHPANRTKASIQVSGFPDPFPEEKLRDIVSTFGLVGNIVWRDGNQAVITFVKGADAWQAATGLNGYQDASTQHQRLTARMMQSDDAQWPFFAKGVGCRLVVTQLPPGTTKEDVNELFGGYSSVLACKISGATTDSPAATVTFKDGEEAYECVCEMNGTLYKHGPSLWLSVQDTSLVHRTTWDGPLSVIVGRIPLMVSDLYVKDACKPFGRVVKMLDLGVDPDRPQSRLCRVTFASASSALAAVRDLNGCRISGPSLYAYVDDATATALTGHCRIEICGLPLSMDSDSVHQLMNAYGPLHHWCEPSIVRDDPNFTASTTVTTVTFETVGGGMSGLRGLNGRNLDGNPLLCSIHAADVERLEEHANEFIACIHGIPDTTPEPKIHELFGVYGEIEWLRRAKKLQEWTLPTQSITVGWESYMSAMNAIKGINGVVLDGRTLLARMADGYIDITTKGPAVVCIDHIPNATQKAQLTDLMTGWNVQEMKSIEGKQGDKYSVEVSFVHPDEALSAIISINGKHVANSCLLARFDDNTLSMLFKAKWQSRAQLKGAKRAISMADKAKFAMRIPNRRDEDEVEEATPYVVGSLRFPPLRMPTQPNLANTNSMSLAKGRPESLKLAPVESSIWGDDPLTADTSQSLMNSSTRVMRVDTKTTYDGLLQNDPLARMKDLQKALEIEMYQLQNGRLHSNNLNNSSSEPNTMADSLQFRSPQSSTVITSLEGDELTTAMDRAKKMMDQAYKVQGHVSSQIVSARKRNESLQRDVTQEEYMLRARKNELERLIQAHEEQKDILQHKHKLERDSMTTMRQELQQMKERAALHQGPLKSPLPNIYVDANSREHNRFRADIRHVAIQCKIDDEHFRVQKSRAAVIFRREQMLKQELDSIRHSLVRIIHFNTNLIVDMTCKHCLNLYTHARILWPCGHSFCRDCCNDMKIDMETYKCVDCGITTNEGYITNHIVNSLVARWMFKEAGAPDLTQAMTTIVNEIRAMESELESRSLDPLDQGAMYVHAGLVAGSQLTQLPSNRKKVTKPNPIPNL